jgi:Flp pilus assembly pilin Flp
MTPACEDEQGAVATEYALLMMFIALAIMGGILAFGTQLQQSYLLVVQQLANALGGS